MGLAYNKMIQSIYEEAKASAGAKKYKKIKLQSPTGKVTVFREVDLKKVEKESRMIKVLFVDSKGKKTSIAPTTPWDFEGDSDKAFYFYFSDGESIRFDDKRLNEIYKRLNNIVKENQKNSNVTADSKEEEK